MSIEIEFLRDDTNDFSSSVERLERELLQSLRAELVQSKNMSFALIARSAAGDIIGGLTATSSYNWLLIKILWVDKASRGTGLGKKLLQRAEKQGSEIGCHAVWLDTSNPVAERFYTRQGYSEFGRLENEPAQSPSTHRRWFLNKKL